MEVSISDAQLSRFSEFVAQAMGLHFPPARWSDLRRGIAATAHELGLEDSAAAAQWLMSERVSQSQLEILASNLTVGETYFFRESRVFKVLSDEIFPELMRRPPDGRRQLRIWSAACCTGEEPYSIAICLQRAIADWADWNISILGTDINPRFVRKAMAGVFGPWSFRDAPDWLKAEYFRPTADGQFEIVPQIRSMVRFAHLNLALDVYPSLINDTNAMNLIFCRNVLMYFTGEQAERVIEKLYRAQVEGGWLMVSASELPQLSQSAYAPMSLFGATIFQKRGQRPRQVPPPPARINSLFAGKIHAVSPPPVPTIPVMRLAKPPPRLSARSLYEQGRYAEAVENLTETAEHAEAEDVSLLARCLANLGNLEAALECCDRWIAGDKLNANAHYLRAVIRQEQGAGDEAVASLRCALYLDPDMVLAHFALCNIASERGNTDEAEKHKINALRLLSRRGQDDVVPESEGITAGRLATMIGGEAGE